MCSTLDTAILILVPVGSFQFSGTIRNPHFAPADARPGSLHLPHLIGFGAGRVAAHRSETVFPTCAPVAACDVCDVATRPASAVIATAANDTIFRFIRTSASPEGDGNGWCRRKTVTSIGACCAFRNHPGRSCPEI